MRKKIIDVVPRMVTADSSGNIREDNSLLMAACRGNEIFVPDKHDLVPLPPESQLFLLPKRRPCGFNPRSNSFENSSGTAVAAFAAPGYTLSAHPACEIMENAPSLPLFAYGAVGYARGRFWICAKQVDTDPRQRFEHIPPAKIERNCRQLLISWPHNRLVGHIINNCARKYFCPAAKNFALGRFEAPLPTSRVCNAHCLGCISQHQQNTPDIATPQCRLDFTPAASEIAEVMAIHGARERNTPICSFGQGCEGDPLINAELLAESIVLFRQRRKKTDSSLTINCNTNASRPHSVELLAKAGLTSLRASLNSARPEVYNAYYRPADYTFADVRESLLVARKLGVFTSLNLLFFPGITDTAEELEALTGLCRDTGVCMIQWRNLNIDPHWFYRYMSDNCNSVFSRGIGLTSFMTQLKTACPWLSFGYFNPWLGEHAEIAAPLP